MAWDSWKDKIGEVKPYQKREFNFASFDNMNRYNQNDYSDTLKAIQGTNNAAAKQVLEGVKNGSIKLKPKYVSPEITGAEAIMSDWDPQFEYGGGKGFSQTPSISPPAGTLVQSRGTKKRGLLGKIGGFLKGGFGF